MALGKKNIECSSNYKQISGHVHVQTRLDECKRTTTKKEFESDKNMI